MINKEMAFRAVFSDENDRKKVGKVFVLNETAFAIVGLGATLAVAISGAKQLVLDIAFCAVALSLIITDIFFYVYYKRKLSSMKIEQENPSYYPYVKKLLKGNLIYILSTIIGIAFFSLFTILSNIFENNKELSLVGFALTAAGLVIVVIAYLIIVMMTFFASRKLLNSEDFLREYNLMAKDINGNLSGNETAVPTVADGITETYAEYQARTAQGNNVAEGEPSVTNSPTDDEAEKNDTTINTFDENDTTTNTIDDNSK